MKKLKKNDAVEDREMRRKKTMHNNKIWKKKKQNELLDYWMYKEDEEEWEEFNARDQSDQRIVESKTILYFFLSQRP
jgi:hypothetical protein